MNSYLQKLYTILIQNSFNQFLVNISLPVINNDFFNLYENDPNTGELLISLKCMQHNKTTGNDGLTKEFYETFQNERKTFLKSLKQAKEKGQLSISQL